jgi:hypothetical protein
VKGRVAIGVKPAKLQNSAKFVKSTVWEKAEFCSFAGLTPIQLLKLTTS